MIRFLPNVGCLFTLALLTLSCGKNNPTEAGDLEAGSLAERPEQSNQAVTEEHHEKVAFSVYLNTLHAFNALLQRGYEKKGSDGNIVLQNEEIAGLEFGKAFGSGTMTARMSSGTLQSLEFHVDCTYYDYSSFTGLWIGGKVTYTGVFDSRSGTLNLTTNGAVPFNGVYAGSMQVNATSFGTFGERDTVLSVITTSGGATLTDTFSEESGTTAKILGKGIR